VTERPLHSRRTTVATTCRGALYLADKTTTVATVATVGIPRARRAHVGRDPRPDRARGRLVSLQVEPSRRYATVSDRLDATWRGRSPGEATP
jgi:hypothetical protein